MKTTFNNILSKQTKEERKAARKEEKRERSEARENWYKEKTLQDSPVPGVGSAFKGVKTVTGRQFIFPRSSASESVLSANESAAAYEARLKTAEFEFIQLMEQDELKKKEDHERKTLEKNDRILKEKETALIEESKKVSEDLTALFLANLNAKPFVPKQREHISEAERKLVEITFDQRYLHSQEKMSSFSLRNLRLFFPLSTKLPSVSNSFTDCLPTSYDMILPETITYLIDPVAQNLDHYLCISGFVMSSFYGELDGMSPVMANWALGRGYIKVMSELQRLLRYALSKNCFNSVYLTMLSIMMISELKCKGPDSSFFSSAYIAWAQSVDKNYKGPVVDQGVFYFYSLVTQVANDESSWTRLKSHYLPGAEGHPLTIKNPPCPNCSMCRLDESCLQSMNVVISDTKEVMEGKKISDKTIYGNYVPQMGIDTCRATHYVHDHLLNDYDREVLFLVNKLNDSILTTIDSRAYKGRRDGDVLMSCAGLSLTTAIWGLTPSSKTLRWFYSQIIGTDRVDESTLKYRLEQYLSDANKQGNLIKDDDLTHLTADQLIGANKVSLVKVSNMKMATIVLIQKIGDIERVYPKYKTDPIDPYLRRLPAHPSRGVTAYESSKVFCFPSCSYGLPVLRPTFVSYAATENSIYICTSISGLIGPTMIFALTDESDPYMDNSKWVAYFEQIVCIRKGDKSIDYKCSVINGKKKLNYMLMSKSQEKVSELPEKVVIRGIVRSTGFTMYATQGMNYIHSTDNVAFDPNADVMTTAGIVTPCSKSVFINEPIGRLIEIDKQFEIDPADPNNKTKYKFTLKNLEYLFHDAKDMYIEIYGSTVHRDMYKSLPYKLINITPNSKKGQFDEFGNEKHDVCSVKIGKLHEQTHLTSVVVTVNKTTMEVTPKDSFETIHLVAQDFCRQMKPEKCQFKSMSVQELIGEHENHVSAFLSPRDLIAKGTLINVRTKLTDDIIKRHNMEMYRFSTEISALGMSYSLIHHSYHRNLDIIVLNVTDPYTKSHYLLKQVVKKLEYMNRVIDLAFEVKTAANPNNALELASVHFEYLAEYLNLILICPNKVSIPINIFNDASPYFLKKMSELASIAQFLFYIRFQAKTVTKFLIQQSFSMKNFLKNKHVPYGYAFRTGSKKTNAPVHSRQWVLDPLLNCLPGDPIILSKEDCEKLSRVRCCETQLQVGLYRTNIGPMSVVSRSDGRFFIYDF